MLYKTPGSAVGAAVFFKNKRACQSEHLPGNLNNDYAQEGEAYSNEYLDAKSQILAFNARVICKQHLKRTFPDTPDNSYTYHRGISS
jgi:hypothetical protein